MLRIPSSKQNPVEDRRTNIIARLEEQKLLIGNPSYVRIEKHWTKVEGRRTLAERQKRVNPWWRTAPDGSIVFFARAARKPLEFEKGKAGIAVATKEKLAAVIDTVIAAAKAGELDGVLKQAAKARPAPKRMRITIPCAKLIGGMSDTASRHFFRLFRDGHNEGEGRNPPTVTNGHLKRCLRDSRRRRCP